MNLVRLLIFLLCCGAISPTAFAQSNLARGESSKAGESSAAGKSPSSDDLEKKTATELFEDANSYARKKFDAFEKLKMPYDNQLKQKIEKEQRELAARYAGVLAARKLSG